MNIVNVVEALVGDSVGFIIGYFDLFLMLLTEELDGDGIAASTIVLLLQ